MRVLFFFIPVFFVLSIQIHSSNANETTAISLKVNRVMAAVSPNAISDMHGFIGSRLLANKDNYLHRFDIDTYVRFVEERKYRDWKWVGEHPGKWLESAIYVSETFNDQALNDKARSILERLIQAQETSGYLGVTDPEVRTEQMPLRGMDAYELYFTLHSLLTANALWKHDEALKTAQRLGDYFVDTIGEGKAEFWPGPKGKTIAGHNVHYSLEGTLLIDPMLRLYTMTGEKKYLEWSKWCVDNIDRWSGYDTFSNLDKVAKGEISINKIQRYVHSHTLHMNLIGFLRLYQITGDRTLLHKVLGAWHDISHRQMYITGGVSFDEHYEKDYNLPIDGREIETCALMSWIELCQYLLELTGDSIYADAIERLLYNHLFAAQTVDGDSFRYHTPLNGTKPAKYYHGPDCCTASGPRISSKIPSLQYSIGKKSIYVNQFLDSTATIPLESGSIIEIVQTTRYPEKESIVIAVNPQKDEHFSMNVRLPAWCNQPVVKVNDDVIPKLRSGQYAELDRIWSKGDKITLHFSMEPDWVKRLHVDFDNRWALVRGPLVYAIDTVLWNSQERKSLGDLPDDLSKSMTWSISEKDLFGGLKETSLPTGALGPGYSVNVTLANQNKMNIRAWPFVNTGQRYQDRTDKPDHDEKRFAYAVWLPRDNDCVSFRPVLEKQIPAFPGAGGAGANTPGGRGGRVIAVTNLNDSGAGSLRAAVEAEGPRIVIFKTSGIVSLESNLTITNPFLTIAGQSAPGDGICVRGHTTEINTHDVIIRYMRFRRGNIKDRNDALGGYPRGNIIIDHCSTSWGLDENISFYRYIKEMSDGTQRKLPAENVTIQWCISSEALDLNNHAFGGTWGGRNGSFHHNLFACNTGRNSSIGWGDHIDFRNNVIFNWRHRTVDGGDNSSNINVVANYYTSGPATNDGSSKHRICRLQHLDMLSEFYKPGKWFVDGNFVDGFPSITNQNWNGGVQFDLDGNPSEDVIKMWIARKRASLPNPVVPIEWQTAEKAYELVLSQSGAILPKRDSVDKRIVDSVRTGKPTVGNGIIDIPHDVGGWPDYQSEPAPQDTDGDGMPDKWEMTFGLKLTDPSDTISDCDNDGYTNIEEWLNGTDPTQFIDYTKPENNKNTL
jgi:DUF1680 family protein